MATGDELRDCSAISAVHHVSVPGRLCILGEHTDWAAGYRDRNRGIPPGFTIVATTQEGLHARVSSRADGRLVFRSCPPSPPGTGGQGAPDGAQTNGHTTVELDVPMTEEALQDVVDAKGFFMYVAGTALTVCTRFGLFSPSSSSSSSSSSTPTSSCVEGGVTVTAGNGVTIDNYLTTLPLKKGLSSSAAVCVLVVRALCAVHGLELSIPQVMELAHLGETRSGSKCGRMDQCCALGANHVAAMFFDGDDVQIYEVAPPECGIFLVVADLNGSKDTIKMLGCLNSCFPEAKDEREEKVHRYVRDNNTLAWRAVAAIELGDAQDLGRAMNLAQESFDDCAIPICPSEFSSPLLHAVMADQRVKNLTWGIKGVGAQGDGSVQLLARGREEQEELTRVLEEKGMTCVFPVTVMRSTETACGDATASGVGGAGDSLSSPSNQQEASALVDKPSAGCVGGPARPMMHPRRVRSAVIVAAGLSTRMFPASAVVKKELFPIVDHDGVCKPVILAIMEGLVESGIERFVVVVQEKDIAVFDNFFSMKAVEKHKHRLKPPQRAYCAKVEALRARITYAVQDRQEGFGHAVYCARHALGVEDHERNGGAAARKSGDFESPENDREGEGAAAASNGVGAEAKDAESFLLVLGDHLYRRGAGTTQACASQLIHAFLEHGEAGKPAIGLKVMGESSVSPYGVAAGHCVAHPPAHTLERWQRAAVPAAPAAETTSTASVTTSEPVGAGGETQPPLPLGGRVYRLTKLAEKPTAEFARENLVTPGLGRGFDGKGKHLVVFGQYVLPTVRTFDILAEDIRADRRERGEFQLTSVLDRMRREDEGMLGCVIHGDALDMGIPQPYVETMGSFAEPHRV